jgi:hypothetical protein
MKIVLALCLIIFALSVGKAQEPKRLAEHSIRCSGLTTLPFSGKESKSRELEPRSIDGVEVRVKSHQLSEEQIVFLESCSPKEGKKLEAMDERDGRQASVVRGFLIYEARGRIFAYSFTAYLVMVKDGLILERYGAAGNIYYVDEDGSGTFVRRQGAKPLKSLPNWVKAKALSNNSLNRS